MRWTGGLAGPLVYDPDYEPTPIERWCSAHIFEIVVATLGGPVVIAFIVQAIRHLK